MPPYRLLSFRTFIDVHAFMGNLYAFMHLNLGLG